MKVFDIIKIGSNLLKSKKIPSYILDSELLLSKTLDKSREEILTNLDQKVDEKKFFLFNQYLLIPLPTKYPFPLFQNKIAHMLPSCFLLFDKYPYDQSQEM